MTHQRTLTPTQMISFHVMTRKTQKKRTLEISSPTRVLSRNLLSVMRTLLPGQPPHQLQLIDAIFQHLVLQTLVDVHVLTDVSVARSVLSTSVAMAPEPGGQSLHLPAQTTGTTLFDLQLTLDGENGGVQPQRTRLTGSVTSPIYCSGICQKLPRIITLICLPE